MLRVTGYKFVESYVSIRIATNYEPRKARV